MDNNSIISQIGNTPLVKLKQASELTGCYIYGKAEYLNPGESVKDRAALFIVKEALKKKKITKGGTIVEGTAGNTGIGLALCGAIKGYRVIIVLPEKMSLEKVNTLKALGAEIIRTPTEEPWDSPKSHIGVAKKLNSEIPNSHILDQYKNINNPINSFNVLDLSPEKIKQLINKVRKIKIKIFSN